MVDPIADMLNRIRNAQAVSKETVELPFSKAKYGIAKILEQQGYVEKVDFKGRKSKKTIEIRLRYKEEVPVIRSITRVSKPGQRHYASTGDLKLLRNKHRTAILSTSHGLMTDEEARKKNVGGEIICEIW